MELDDGHDDDEPIPPLLPPDDRLWRHPSELAQAVPRRRGDGRVLLIATLSGVIGALLATGVLTVTGTMRARTDTIRTVVQREASPLAVPVAAGAGIVEVAEKAKPAVVEVHVDDNERQDGSGVVFRSDGHVLTSAHVLGEAKSVRVVLADGEWLEAAVVGRDHDTDLAVLKVDRTGMEAAALGSVAGLKVGHVAIVVGSSLALGVVSALGREVAMPDGPLLLDMIQTDAPVAPTSSGGALVDAAGGVIGITTAVDGVGYATPIDLARDVADQLVATGSVAHAWLGVEGDDLEADDARRLGVDGGAVVRRVREGSPAAAAGLAARDVVVAVDGATVQSMSALKVAIRGRRPGQAVDLRFLRDGKEQRVVATLAPRPAV
ncbi:MAG TPA: trypsin-like peptidase domain-containing protein [Acidimicrobiales bacterium]|nr:trypsin-like peptidase domain-containing protein [Acidimicrobiales bacterium]